jgi:SAM-dependent methyltransferase
MTENEPLEFDFEGVFEPSDYMLFYRHALTEELTQLQVDFLVRELELFEPLRILDMACGFGRHPNKLAILGHSVTGVDFSPHFLAIARQKAKEIGVQVEYIKGDMRRFVRPNSFDRAMLMFTALGYFTDDENKQVLANISERLKPGGLLCLDIPNRDSFLTHFQPQQVLEADDAIMIERCWFDSISGRIYNKRAVFRDGKWHNKFHFVRFYNPTELGSLLENVGLRRIKIFANYRGVPFESKSKQQVVIAQRG